MQTADVEQRHGGERGGLQTAGHDGGHQVGRGHASDGADVVDVVHRLADRALARQHPLGLAAGARGEEDQGVVFGGQRWRMHGGRTWRDQGRPARMALGWRAIDHRCQAGQGVQFRLHIRHPLGVANEPARLQVAQTGHQFLAQAKAVQRRRHSADQDRSGKGHRPFGPVAHGDRNPVAGLDLVIGLQATGQGINRLVKTVVGPAVVLVHHEFARPVSPTSLDPGGQRAECMAVDGHALTVDGLINGLERGAGRGQLCATARGQRQQFGRRCRAGGLWGGCSGGHGFRTPSNKRIGCGGKHHRPSCAAARGRV